MATGFRRPHRQTKFEKPTRRWEAAANAAADSADRSDLSTAFDSSASPGPDDDGFAVMPKLTGLSGKARRDQLLAFRAASEPAYLDAAIYLFTAAGGEAWAEEESAPLGGGYG